MTYKTIYMLLNLVHWTDPYNSNLTNSIHRQGPPYLGHSHSQPLGWFRQTSQRSSGQRRQGHNSQVTVVKSRWPRYPLPHVNPSSGCLSLYFTFHRPERATASIFLTLSRCQWAHTLRWTGGRSTFATGHSFSCRRRYQPDICSDPAALSPSNPPTKPCSL